MNIRSFTSPWAQNIEFLAIQTSFFNTIIVQLINPKVVKNNIEKTKINWATEPYIHVVIISWGDWCVAHLFSNAKFIHYLQRAAFDFWSKFLAAHFLSNDIDIAWWTFQLTTPFIFQITSAWRWQYLYNVTLEMSVVKWWISLYTESTAPTCWRARYFSLRSFWMVRKRKPEDNE